MKNLPLALATAAIVATQIACTYYETRTRPVEVFADHAQQVYFDGDTVRVDLGRKRLQVEKPEIESTTVIHLELSQSAAFALHAHLSNVISASAQKPSTL